MMARFLQLALVPVVAAAVFILPGEHVADCTAQVPDTATAKTQEAEIAVQFDEPVDRITTPDKCHVADVDVTLAKRARAA